MSTKLQFKGNANCHVAVQACAIDLDQVKPLPQVDLLPVNQNNFLRTVWTDDAGLGKGFERLGSVFKPSAISFSAYDVGVPVTSQTQSFECASSQRLKSL